MSLEASLVAGFERVSEEFNAVRAESGGRQELACAFRTHAFTTTNTSAYSQAGIISGLSIAIIGTGRPVEISFQTLLAQSSASSGTPYYAGACLYQDNAAEGMIWSQHVPHATIGVTMRGTHRVLVPEGIMRVYQVSMYQSPPSGVAQGTLSLLASNAIPIMLKAVET